MKKSAGAKTYLYPTPVLVVGTYDIKDKPNLVTIAWGGICCSKPPCIAISLRKATYTYGSIVQRKAFSVNIASDALCKTVDYIGLVSGKDTNKFKDCNLTAIKSEIIDAPLVKEFPLSLECKLIHTLEIGLHTQFIGEILDVKAEESILDDNGRISTELLKPFVFTPGDRNYYETGAKIGDAFAIGKNLRE